MSWKSHLLAVVFRLAGGVAGLLAGGLLGALVLIVGTIFSGSAFGLDSVLPGVIIGGAVGLVLSLCFPRAAVGVFGWLLSGF